MNFFSLKDIHTELCEKLKKPNLSLLPASRRPVPDAPPKSMSTADKIFEEFKKKLEERGRE